MLHSLQACRALATLLVVVYHANHSIFGLPKYFATQPVGRFFDFAYGAVDFFFVLSGFIILYVHTKDINRPEALPGYLWRRFSRVFLFYWIVLALVVPVFFLFSGLGRGDERNADLILRSVFLLPHPDGRSIIVAAWTMVYEMLFYLVFALSILNRRLGIAALLGWFAGVLFIPRGDNYVLNFIFSNLHLRFAAGMFACLAVQHCRIPAPRLVSAAGAAIFMVGAAINVLAGSPQQFPVAALYVIGSAVALVGLAAADRSQQIHSPQWLVKIGDAAYAIYLVHFPALSVTAKISKALHLDHAVPIFALFVVNVAAAVALGLLCHRLLEQPLHLWTKQFFGRRKAVRRDPVAAYA